MGKRQKVAIIGAGHNGLVCACYLARANFDVTVYEQRPSVGGLCATELLFPGVEASSIAGYYGMFRPEIIEDLNLGNYGLESYLTDPVEIVLLPNKQFLYTPRHGGTARVAIEGINEQELAGWRRFWDNISKASQIIAPLHFQPNGITQKSICTLIAENGLSDIAHRLFQGSLLDLAQEYFKNDTLMAALSTTTIGFPNAKGSVYSCIYLGTAETCGHKGAWGLIKGGMGAICKALSQVATNSGVKIIFNYSVKALSVNDSTVNGIVDRGDIWKSYDTVISNADPVSTFTKLVPSKYRTKNIEKQLSSGRFDISAGKAHFLLNKLPVFPVLEGIDHHHSCAFVIAPSLEDVLKAAKVIPTGYMSNDLMITMVMPAITDDTISSAGKYLLSLDYHWLPSLCNGEPWNEHNKKVLYQATINVLEKHVPDFESLIKDYRLIAPSDLEQKYGLTSKHCWHVPMTSEFLVENRCFGATPYSTHLNNFYLCGAGTYPGGNVTGAPGYNCAQEIISRNN